jgi:hypothetical protein
VWDDADSEKEDGILRRLSEINEDGTFTDSDEIYWENYRPTGYRWDTETQSIVPIEDGE